MTPTTAVAPDTLAGGWSLATLDLAGVPRCAHDDGDGLVVALERALTSVIGAIAWNAHRFAPKGLSLVGTAVRGRVIVHTWPEQSALTVDLYGEPGGAGPALAAVARSLTERERAVAGSRRAAT
ncbi:MAG TPA: S-adenosylmethionine decarboxylase [Polyangiaceae bacterium]|jgi:S-adenosylmethionine/arginine decarboxylase-like enzyme|nr:S-adenosylmethionine decarboxylase [Polyangiaceae bacterium]